MKAESILVSFNIDVLENLDCKIKWLEMFEIFLTI